jgi:O-antigen/teichoic acid export membrane protein
VVLTSVVLLWQNSLEAFFYVQIAANALETLILLFFAWRHLEVKWRTPVSIQSLRPLLSQSMIMTFIALLGVAMGQLDKLAGSKLLTLSDLGIYSAATAFAAGLIAFSYSVNNALYPTLSALYEDANHKGIQQKLTEAVALMSLFLIPAIAVIIPQAHQVAFYKQAWLPANFNLLMQIVPLIVIGGVLQSYVGVPSVYQFASGRPASILWTYVFCVSAYLLMLVTILPGGNMQTLAWIFMLFNALLWLVEVVVAGLRMPNPRFWWLLWVRVAVLALAALTLAYLTVHWWPLLNGWHLLLRSLLIGLIAFILTAYSFPVIRGYGSQLWQKLAKR